MAPGDCSAHLAEALDARGSWNEAEREADKGCMACEGFEGSHVGLASYTLGDIERRRGSLGRAAEAFGRASEHGIVPQPGLALLLLAKGDKGGAFASIKACLDGTRTRLARARLLPSAVDVAWPRAN